MASPELVKALYPYSGGDQAVPLPFAGSAILLVAERTGDGWCRGFSSGKEGWFPASYVTTLDSAAIVQTNGIQPAQLAAVMYSSNWIVYCTEENRIYYVNTQTQATTWELPVGSIPSSPVTSPILEAPEPSWAASLAQLQDQSTNGPLKSKPRHERKKPKLHVVNGLTFQKNGPEQELLNGSEVSYVDHFWADKGDQTGFDIILEKHLNGKAVMKDIAEFTRERAAIEEQYAKNLMKLSKSTLGESEQGTLGIAWQAVKIELRNRSEAHSKFATQLLKDLEKPLFEFKESQKKMRKEHQQIMERSRKQIQALDASIEKSRAVFSGKVKATKKSSRDENFPTPAALAGLGRRRSSAVPTGDEMKKLEESYNQSQRQWIDDMINACRDFERQEEERSDYLKDHLLKYVDLCVGVDEASADSLSRVTDAIDRIKKHADKEYFIKLRGTGTLRPVDRIVEL